MAILSISSLSIEQIASEYKKHVENNFWIEENGIKIPRYKYYNVQRRVAMAACKYKDLVIVGVRHHCPTMSAMIDLIGRKELWNYAGEDVKQGFIDQYGMFLTREEAYHIAVEANQIIRETPGLHDDKKLYSENIV